MAQEMPEEMPPRFLEDQEIAEIREPTPPSPNDQETDYKGSRKREREVSIEPLTPNTEVGISSEIKERRIPATKKRVLGATAEEEITPPGTPNQLGLPSSPPHETKVRQIGEKVRGLRWDDKDRASFQDLAHADAGVDSEITDVSHDISSQTPNVDFPILDSTEETSGADDSSALVKATDSDSDDQDKKLKRKLGDRAVSGSEIPVVNNSEPSKRARDDAQQDDNPREKKRPTPPPDENKEPSPKGSTSTADSASTATPQPRLTGFLAYASASPFGAAKGPSVFGRRPSPFAGSGTSASASGSTTPSVLASPSPKEAFGGGIKRTGFEAFTSSSSPFASVARSKSPTSFGSRNSSAVRSKSPTRRPANALNAFASYASGPQAFTTPPVKKLRQDEGSGSEVGDADKEASPMKGNGRAADDSEEEGGSRSSFGERLRAERNQRNALDEEEQRLALTEQEVHTGEEEEETLFQVRAKLYGLSDQNQWKERGTGLLKLNVRRIDCTGARLVMRKEAVHSLLLNITLFKGMRCMLAQDPRYVRFSTIEEGKAVHYNLRLASAKVADELLDEIHANIPVDEPDQSNSVV